MTLTFAHDGLVLSVDAPDDDLRWLEEFVDPSFARVPAGEPLVRLSFEQVSGSGPGGEPAGRVAFTLDSGAIRLPESRIGGGVRLHDASCGVAIDVTAEGRDTGIRYGGSRSRARIRLMRVVREYAHNHSVSSGGLMLHAAGLTIGGVALAIAGSKGAGKTTLALRLLALPGVGYLSNDRVLVRAQPEPRAVAVPTVVAVRAGTRALMPEIAARLQQAGDFREHAGEREARGASAPVTDGDAWHLSPHQLCSAIDRPLAATAPLAAVLFPVSARPALVNSAVLTPVKRLTRSGNRCWAAAAASTRRTCSSHHRAPRRMKAASAQPASHWRRACRVSRPRSPMTSTSRA